jgi:cytidyltransferase-like protein
MKLINISDAEIISKDLKKSNKKVVLCHGSYDLLHPGHIKHFVSAKKKGDILFVSITADEYIQKGPGRPIFNEKLRAESIGAIEAVDFVFIVNHATGIPAINSVIPDIYVKGIEYAEPMNDPTGKIRDEIIAVNQLGGKIDFTDEVVFSSSKLINSHYSVYPDNVNRWLYTYRKKYSATEILEWLEKIAKLRVMVIGETIIDEYCFCKGLGKVAKDPILAFLYEGEEKYAGGSVAVSNHASQFASSVSLVTLLGDKDREEDFICQSFRGSIKLHAVTEDNATTIHKKRFVDQHTGNKVFELYSMSDFPMQSKVEDKLLSVAKSQLKECDVIIASDYGHGMIGHKLAKILVDSGKFLVINTQANAGNRGFNTLSKYSGGDYVCITGNELELEMRKKNDTHKNMLLSFAKQNSFKKYTITLGHAGTIHYDSIDQSFFEAPALATKVVDRVGAGDAVLVVTGLLAACGAPQHVIGLVGNIVGAEMVKGLGNKVAIDKGQICKHIISLLKL